MGIAKLNQLLRSKCPWVFKEVHLSEFAYTMVSIDVSLFMCKYKCLGENWLECFMNLILCLRRNDIHCVFILDSGHPPEKIQEKEERVQAREKLKLKIDALENALVKYEETGVMDDELNDLYVKSRETGDKSRILRSIIDKKKLALFDITKEDWVQLKKLFDIMNVSYYYAPLEAETMCADLCKRGLVSAAISEDTDVLAYGSKVFLTKIDTYSNTGVKIEYQDILDGLKLTSEQFLDLCIMCGTDYNKNIPKIGCETAYKYISMYGSIEEIAKQKQLDVSILKHERNRELFTQYDKFEFEGQLKYNGHPDYDKLEAILPTVDTSRIRRSLKAKIVFL